MGSNIAIAKGNKWFHGTVFEAPLWSLLAVAPAGDGEEADPSELWGPAILLLTLCKRKKRAANGKVQLTHQCFDNYAFIELCFKVMSSITNGLDADLTVLQAFYGFT